MSLDLTNTTPQHPPAPTPQDPRTLPATRAPLPSAGGVGGTVLISVISVAIIVGVLIAAEKFAPAEWKPSFIIGHFTGSVESEEIKAQLDAVTAREKAMAQELARKEAEIVDLTARMQMVTTQYQTEAAMRQEAFQNKLQRVGQAYEVLFQRATLLNQMHVDLMTNFAKMKVNKANAQTAGKDLAAMLGDLIKHGGEAFGNPQLAAAGARMHESARRETQEELNAAIDQALPEIKASPWIAALPTPDQLAAELVAEPAIAAPKLPVPPKRAAPPVTPYTAPN